MLSLVHNFKTKFILSMYLLFLALFSQFCTHLCRHLPYGNPKFSITFPYLNIYVSTQKSPQTFLYRLKKYCKSFKSFGELGKKIFSIKFFQVAISPSAKNRMILTAPYSEVSSAITNLFLSVTSIYGGHVQKKFECI